MARVQGARVQMALAFETVYGTLPASGFMKMPFPSSKRTGASFLGGAIRSRHSLNAVVSPSFASFHGLACQRLHLAL